MHSRTTPASPTLARVAFGPGFFHQTLELTKPLFELRHQLRLAVDAIEQGEDLADLDFDGLRAIDRNAPEEQIRRCFDQHPGDSVPRDERIGPTLALTADDSEPGPERKGELSIIMPLHSVTSIRGGADR
jgi:hypothetical protein